MARIICLLMGLFLLAAPIEAAPQVIRASGVYVMGDSDSPKVAREAARAEAMRSATEQAGVYVESYSRTQNMELTADDVRVISGTVLKVLDEKATPSLEGGVWKYTVDLTAEVDTDDIDLKALMEKRTEIEKLQQERDELKRQNEELLEKYEHATGGEKQAIGSRLESQYTLSQVFDRAVRDIQRGDQHSAIRDLTALIRDKGVTDSPLAYAYYLRGRAYYELNSDEYALKDFSSAQSTPHDNSIYPVWRCHKYRGLIYYDQRRYEESYDELRLAWDASPKDDEELWNALEKARERATYVEPEEEETHSSGLDWGELIGSIIIGSIQQETYHAASPRHAQGHAAPPRHEPAPRHAPPPPPRH